MVPALSEAVSIILSRTADDAAICREIAALLPVFLAQAHLLPEGLRRPDPAGYRRSLLHEQPDGRFSIGCFAWAPGQHTPIHDHSGWGVIGVASGMLRETSYRHDRGTLTPGETRRLAAGSCAWCLPAEGDIHRVGADGAGAALSIHVYGARFAAVCRNLYP